MTSETLLQWLQQLILVGGIGGIFVAMLIEHLIPFAPASLILTGIGIGFVDPTNGWTVLAAISASTLGSISGAVVLYLLGRWYPTRRKRPATAPRGRFAQLPATIATMPSWGLISLRWIPSIRTHMSLVAGIAQLSPRRFLWTSSSGMVVWNSLWILGGSQLQALWA